MVTALQINPTQSDILGIEYSPLQHIAISVRLNGWRKALFVMLALYSDCSRSGQNDGVTVVSGWLSSGELWLGFESDWATVLRRFDVPYFHMKEYAHSTGAFETGWRGENEKRQRFIEALLAVIDRYALASFASMIERKTFDEVNREFQVREYFGTEFAICARLCIAEANRWMREHAYEPPPEYVFEDGDPRGRLTWLLESIGYPPPSYKPSRDRLAKDGTMIRGLLPLQAADFAAYELRKNWDDVGDITDPAELERYRKSFRGIGRVSKGEGFWGCCTADDLRQMCGDIGVTRR